MALQTAGGAHGYTVYVDRLEVFMAAESAAVAPGDHARVFQAPAEEQVQHHAEHRHHQKHRHPRQ